jgi:hypothetical protein
MKVTRRRVALLAIPVAALAVTALPAGSAWAGQSTTVSSGNVTCSGGWSGDYASGYCASGVYKPDVHATMHVGCNLNPVVLTDNVTPVDDGGYWDASANNYCWQGVNDVWFTFS